MTEVHRHGSPPDPAGAAGHVDAPPRVGFFTDTSVCIGCKASEVACKEWNEVPGEPFDLLGMSHDNTGALGADSWRHVAFIEQRRDGGSPGEAPSVRWLMSSDVCKHCTHAACLDVCPTGALFRTRYGTVVVQPDICNGCGYCVPACPFGVIERRTGPRGTKDVGVAQKCTLCYDRLDAGLRPACAQACPTESIRFGELVALRREADERLAVLRAAGETGARLYGHDDGDGVGGAGAFFLLLDEPETYGLPPDPVVTTKDLPRMYRRAAAAAAVLVAGVAVAFLGGAS